MEPWKVLLRRALDCLDTLDPSVAPVPPWTMGGGTMLMIRHLHRLSRDVDIFIRDAQSLPRLSPRLNDDVGAMVSDYHEQSAALKLSFPEGDVDFIVAPSLLGLAEIPMSFDERSVATDHSAEIVAKKLFYRSAQFKTRDVFDLAVVLDAEPECADLVRPILAGRRAQIDRRLADLAQDFEQRISRELDLLPAGEAIAPRCLQLTRSFVDSLAD